MPLSRTLFGLLILFSILGNVDRASAQPVPLRPEARDQIRRLIEEKAARSPIERKIGSRLLYASRMKRGREAAPGLPSLRVDLDLDESGRVLVDIQVDMGVDLAPIVRSLNGEVVVSLPMRGALRARVPFEALTSLASQSEVRSVKPAAHAHAHKINTSEGDVRHGGPTLRSALDVDGSGVIVGVLSDGVDSLASLQSSGDVAAETIVLPGQAGSGDEGSAMLEIVHDLAPGASLLFATAFNGQASFAANIVALRDAGADVIVDDVGYFAESVFQDDDVAQAVDLVTASGALYFSSAGNSGNLDDGTSGVYEGDFVPGSGTIAGGTPHDYGGGVILNKILATSPFAYSLHWSDPNGASANDYDLFMLNKRGNLILAASSDIQDGNDDPFEIIGVSPNDVGRNLVIVRATGASRFLHLNANRGRIANATHGQTSGHSSARNAFSVAAVDARTGSGPFDGSESVETYSSDGPRRVFYDSDGTAFTPGDFSASGGEVRQKPDLSAADCVSTASPGFSTFCGTSAAAPHAAALAALLLEAAPSASLAEIRAALTSSALDIEAPGVDPDSGAGIVFGPSAGEVLPECSIDTDCDDGAFCTGVETCSAGSCVGGAGDPCPATADPLCDEATDSCVACLADLDCSDGLFCTGIETCSSGACTAGPGDPCIGGPEPSCDESLGVCVECLADSGCDDGLFCNGIESCAAGSCVGGPGDPCLATSSPFCAEELKLCLECGGDDDCQDGVFCNGAEICDAGSCFGSATTACADAEASICLEQEMICIVCAIDADCGAGSNCQAGTCVQAVPSEPAIWPWLSLVLALAGLWLLREPLR